jgi:uncharacterized protein YoxC
MTWQIIGMILLAIIVGALIPVLVQLRKTLRAAETVLSTTGPKIDKTLDEVSEAASRINQVGRSLERDAEGLRVFTDAAANLGKSLKQAHDTLRTVTAVGAAVGPAIAAGLRSLFTSARDDEAAPPRRDHAAPAEAPETGAVDARLESLGKEAPIGHG